MDRLFSSLGDMEQISIELEAEERGVNINTVVFEVLREELAVIASVGIDEFCEDWDRQWKSH